MSARLFGQKLAFALADLRVALTATGVPFLEELAEAHGVPRKQLQKLESGTWGELSHQALFFLIALAEDHRLPSFIRTAENPMWRSFRGARTGNLLLVGTNLDGNTIEGDNLCAEDIRSGISVQQVSVQDDDAEQYRDLIGRRNVVTLGGSKVNRATEFALMAFRQAGGPRVKFLWPNYRRDTDVSGPSPEGLKGIVIDGTEHFEDRPGRRLGIIGVMMQPVKSAEIAPPTTIVISGCSKVATRALTSSLSDPQFNALYHDGWETGMIGKPILFFYDSSGRVPWTVLNAHRPRRPRGRPAGRRTRRRK